MQTGVFSRLGQEFRASASIVLGQRYVLDFELAGPNGSAIIRSAWIIRTGENVPRLVTCYIL